MNDIRHNYPSLIHCLWAFHILIFAKLLFRCYCYNHYKTATVTFATITLLPYYFATKNFAANIKSFRVELTTQLLILENILWLPLCRINKFGLNTLPSKTVAIPYTCGLSLHTRSSDARYNTNWVMHQYHLGEQPEGKIGELVACKIFYKTERRTKSRIVR
jgi:hypothetical protein